MGGREPTLGHEASERAIRSHRRQAARWRGRQGLADWRPRAQTLAWQQWGIQIKRFLQGKLKRREERGPNWIYSSQLKLNSPRFDHGRAKQSARAIPRQWRARASGNLLYDPIPPICASVGIHLLTSYRVATTIRQWQARKGNDKLEKRTHSPIGLRSVAAEERIIG